MKKILSLLALALFSVVSFAASITCADIDFGTVSIKGETLPKQGSTTVTVTFAGLAQYYSIYAYITEGLLDDATNPNGFTASPYNQTIKTENGTCEVTVNYSVKAAGTYTGKLEFWCYDKDYNDVYGHANVSITVTDEAIVAKTIPFERVEKTADLKDGDTIVFVCESQGAVCGPLAMPALTSVTENVTINTTTHKAEVPEATAQFFKANKYSDGWQFVTADAAKKGLHLDIEYNSGKGAFTYDAAVAGKILATWGVDISNGVAEVTRNSDGSYPVRWASSSAGGRFKPYKSGDGSTIAIYKKAGKAQELQSKVTISPATIVFEDTEMEETSEVIVNYTAENLTDDIIWAIEGTNSGWFDLIEGAGNNNTSGTLTIKYKGTGTNTGAVNAKLSYLTQNAQLDPMEDSYPISLTLKANTIKLTKIEFVGAPDSLVKGKSIDLKPYLVFTPNNAEDNSLTWSVDKSYQGTVEDGVYTAKNVTGEVVITATSVRVPSVSASVTLMQYEPKPNSITLDKHEITTHIGEVVTLQGIVGPEGASQDCYFTVRNKDILTYGKGDVTGSAKLTAKALCQEGVWVVVNPKNYQTILDSCLVKVVPVAVESVAFDPDSKEMTVGSEFQLAPVVTPSAAASQYTASYESDKTAVATVSETGLVKAVAEGDAVITCTLGGKSGQITIHVVAAKTFAKVTDASSLAAKDTIILALASAPVVAGAISGKILTTLTSGITVTATEAYADNAYRMVITTIKTKTGFALQPVGSSKVLAEQNNDLYLEKTTSTKNLMWEFVADGENGVFIRNLGNTDAMFKYHAGNTAIKPYKAGTVGAVYVYVYVRKYVNPNPPTGMEEAQGDVQSTKVLRNGQIVILRGDKAYTITGQEIR